MKSHYPSTQDPRYDEAVAAQLRDLLADTGHQAFDLLDRRWVAGLVEDEEARRHPLSRVRIERVLNIATWLDIYRPKPRVP